MGRCEAKTGIEPIGRLVERVMRIKLDEELTNPQPRPFAWRSREYDLFNLLQRLARREAAARAAKAGTPASRE